MAPVIKTRAGWVAAWLLVVTLAAGLGCNRPEQRGSDAARGTQAASTAPITPSAPPPAPPQAAAPPSTSVAATMPAVKPVQSPQPKPVSAKAASADAAPSVPPAALAKCLAAKGVTMYGDFRCPHCADQKALFGESFKLVPYVECGTPGKPMTLANQAQACRDLGITKYPTWIFPDGERVANPQPLNALAEKAGCKVR